MRTLIIDDDAAISSILSRCLTLWGREADECHSVSEALALFQRGQYDLVLCDVDLPDGDGIILSRAFLKARPALVVIIISGNPENLGRARNTGLTACLRKPFVLDDLRSLIDLEYAGKS